MRQGIEIHTDGACSGNPGPGGWAAVVLRPDGRVRELAGRAPGTTNNRMELTAAIEGLRSVSRDAGPVRLYTDSTYVISGVTKWVAGWKRRGWTTSSGGPVLNRDLWETLDALAAARGKDLSWRYVRGHSGHSGNERCDALAVALSHGEAPELYEGPLSGYDVDLSAAPPEAAPPVSSSRRGPKKPKGGIYLSLLDGRLERHATWAECQARVHGKPAKFKKVATPEEERATLKGWGL